MVFSSPFFLFLFLPIVLGVYYLLPKRLWNLWLLVASLFFYAWGERLFTFVMLASITMNYGFGLVIERTRGGSGAKQTMIAATVANLLLLIGYKYANFLVGILNGLLAPLHVGSVHLDPVHLPIGISFFTFHALSYVIDVYRGDARGQRDFVKVALYVTLFPQLIAGPILRFHHVANQFGLRSVNLLLFQSGVRRFLVGFGKKVLIANTLAVPADKIFGLSASTLSPGAAWLGIACYTLQIYFDFSGYSDMAIGLGRMFGFQFPENFNYPYISRSIKEFWRRWHISLSTWFRDYLYIPLGGNRVSPGRNYLNLLTVFFLCGLWHGASWTFIVWGLYHGLFLVLEGRGGLRRIATAPPLVGHLYATLVMMIGWVFFRAETLSQASRFLRAMAGFNGGAANSAGLFLGNDVALALLAGIVGSTPICAHLARRVCAWPSHSLGRLGAESVLNAGLLALFILALTCLAAGTYNPFIYFRF
ncbi:MAG: MBOAT family protein [Verrucomicrobiota bacterium]